MYGSDDLHIYAVHILYILLDNPMVVAAGKVDDSCIECVGMIVSVAGLVFAYHLLLQFYLCLMAMGEQISVVNTSLTR